jgi:hypothetical protein
VKEPTLLGEAFGPDGTIEPAGVDRVVVAVNKAMTAALREGIILHYLQTTFNQPFDLPLRPLTGSAYGTGSPDPAGARGVSRMALVSAPGTALTGQVSA